MREEQGETRSAVAARGADRGPRAGVALGRLLAHFSERELVVVVVASVVYVAAHAWAMVPQFGEDDAARLASDAVRWHLSGVVRFETTDYRMRSSPLYIHLLKRAMDVGLPIGAVPRLMSWMSLVAGLVTLLALYAIFRRLSGKAVACAACAIFALTPAGWLSADYGMAHGPSLAFWTVALALLPVTPDGVPRRGLVVRFVAVTVLAFVALSLKADMVLTGLAFPGLVWMARPRQWRLLAAACAVVVVSLLGEVGYSHAVVSPAPAVARASVDPARSTVTFAKEWRRKWPIDSDELTIPEHRRPTMNAMGPFWLALAVIALACHLSSAWGFRLGLLVLAWSCPLVVGWGLVPENNVRHSLGGVPGLSLLIASLVFHLAETWRRSVALLGLLFIPNYYSDTKGTTPGLGTMVPRTDLLQLSVGLRDRSAKMRDGALDFVRLPDAKKAAVERFFLVYEELAFAAAAEKTGHLTFDGRTFRLTGPGGKVQTVEFHYASHAGIAAQGSRKLKGEGFTVWSHDYGKL